MLKFRNILNILFMLGAILGIILYFTVGHTLGTYVILTAIGVKFIECCLRLIK